MLLLKIIGAIVVIWAGFWVIGALFHIIATLLIVAAIVTVAGVGYAAIKGRSQRQIR
jgi:hypothetical protein